VASWSSMDYYGRWKAQQYMAKHAYEDYLISPVKEKDSIKIFAVSDAYQSTNAKMEASLINFEGKTLKTITKQLVLGENSSTEVFALKEADWVSAEHRKRVVLHLKMTVNNKTVENNYYFEKPKDLQLLDASVTIRQIDAHTIEVSAKKLAKGVWLFLPGTDNAFSDNYFDLLPNEKKLIKVACDDVHTAIGKIQTKTINEMVERK